MARYIDADKFKSNLEKAMEKMHIIGGVKAVGMEAVIEALNRQPTADVVAKSEEGAECPTCHGTGRIGTTDWLTKGLSKKQLAEEKAKVIAEHEQHIKTEVAREIFEEIEKATCVYKLDGDFYIDNGLYAELKKKYTEGENEDQRGSN